MCHLTTELSITAALKEKKTTFPNNCRLTAPSRP